MSEEKNEKQSAPKAAKKPAAKKAADKKAADGAVKAQDPQTPANASPEIAAQAPAEAKEPVAPKEPAAPAEPVIEPGKYGKLIEGAGLPVKHLGPDKIGVEMVDCPADRVLETAEFLRDNANCRFDLMLSCAGVDWKDRLESVYHFYSTISHEYLCLKVTAVDEHSPSLTPVYPAANWHERETYDLLGIHYDGHPNLTRILMPIDWLGYPLRKDYTVNDPRLVWNER